MVCPPKVKINWPKSVERDLIYEYSLEVSNIVSQFLSLKDQSVAEINHEVLFVRNAIVQAASKHLTAASRYKKKAYIKDEQLRKLFARRAVMLGNSGKLKDAHLRVVFVKRNITARSWFDSMFTLVVLNLNVLKFNHVTITTVSDTSESALSAEVSW